MAELIDNFTFTQSQDLKSELKKIHTNDFDILLGYLLKSELSCGLQSMRLKFHDFSSTAKTITQRASRDQ